MAKDEVAMRFKRINDWKNKYKTKLQNYQVESGLEIFKQIIQATKNQKILSINQEEIISFYKVIGKKSKTPCPYKAIEALIYQEEIPKLVKQELLLLNIYLPIMNYRMNHGLIISWKE